MPNKSSTITNYRQLIEQLDPAGEPKIRFVYRAQNSISSSGKKLGVFSGSFNPLTFAHLKIIELAEKQKGLKEVLLLLAKANVDKDVFGATLSQRLAILECYAKTQGNLSVAVSSHGRFIDKITALRPLYPSDIEIYFIIGYDTLVRIFDPKYYTDIDKEIDELFTQSEFIVANRGKHGISSIKNFLAQPICSKYAEKIHTIYLAEHYAQMSSTEVRERVKSGAQIDELVPTLVLRWIENMAGYH